MPPLDQHQTSILRVLADGVERSANQVLDVLRADEGRTRTALRGLVAGGILTERTVDRVKRYRLASANTTTEAPPEDARRQRAIVEAHGSDASTREIAGRFGLTPERLLALWAAAGLPTRRAGTHSIPGTLEGRVRDRAACRGCGAVGLLRYVNGHPTRRGHWCQACLAERRAG